MKFLKASSKLYTNSKSLMFLITKQMVLKTTVTNCLTILKRKRSSWYQTLMLRTLTNCPFHDVYFPTGFRALRTRRCRVLPKMNLQPWRRRYCLSQIVMSRKKTRIIAIQTTLQRSLPLRLTIRINLAFFLSLRTLSAQTGLSNFVKVVLPLLAQHF